MLDPKKASPHQEGDRGDSMGSRVLIFVRHGQYVNDEKSRYYGQLTALGRRQAKRTGKRLSEYQFDVAYHSDMPRAVETAAIFFDEMEPLPSHTMKALREITPPLPSHLGENAKQLSPQQRSLQRKLLRTALDTLVPRFLSAPKGNRNKLELIVAHGNLIRYLVRLAMGDKTSEWWRMGTSNCGITILAIRQDGPNALYQYNDVGHLPKSMQTIT
jgi:broad specificity phosphatase PhoE